MIAAIRNNKRKLLVTLAAVVMLVAAFGVYWVLTQSELAAGRKITEVPAGASEVRLLTNEEGKPIYRTTWNKGGKTDLSAEQYSLLIGDEFEELPLYLRLFNVTSSFGLIWVGIGLLAQLIFMARMLVQWAASEKEKRSVVPPMFWWLSLAGASMLIVYFVWRRDAIGVLGQATGWVVYIRNLILLRRESKYGSASAIDALDEEPALEPVKKVSDTFS